jgi:hypothetical protein
MGISHPVKTTIWIWGIFVIVGWVTKALESVLDEVVK